MREGKIVDVRQPVRSQFASRTPPSNDTYVVIIDWLVLGGAPGKMDDGDVGFDGGRPEFGELIVGCGQDGLDAGRGRVKGLSRTRAGGRRTRGGPARNRSGWRRKAPSRASWRRAATPST